MNKNKSQGRTRKTPYMKTREAKKETPEMMTPRERLKLGMKMMSDKK